MRFDRCSASAAARVASACAMCASRWTAALCGAASAAMYPSFMSSIDWICNASMVSPILAISGAEWLSTSPASFSRSVMISSTVIDPMIDRRWPAKMRPVRTSIWSWSVRNRCAALTMLSASLPTLNAITARTFNAMACFVTHTSVTSASRMASVRNRTLRNAGSTNAPCPVTTRKGELPVRFLPPEISIASLGAGTR